MQTVVWLVVVLVVVLVAVAMWLAMKQRRSTQLRERFGPEYDRAVEAADTPREAQQVLADRERRREALHIVPLSEPVRLRYAEQWRSVQERFVDQPAEAVDSAQQLLDRVMNDRGYPSGGVEEQADLISVDHPGVVENYRIAHDIHRRTRLSTHGQDERDAHPGLTTEDLREALVRYRSLFEELLAPEHDGSADLRDHVDLRDHADLRDHPDLRDRADLRTTTDHFDSNRRAQR